jgi:hypothetical protein
VSAPQGGGASVPPTNVVRPVTGGNIDAARVRAAERALVALAADSQRTGTGYPSTGTITAAQRSTDLPTTGQLDTQTRVSLGELVASPDAMRVLPPRDARHRAAREIAALAVQDPRSMGPGHPRADWIRARQGALTVPASGRIDQPTALAALTELARD